MGGSILPNFTYCYRMRVHFIGGPMVGRWVLREEGMWVYEFAQEIEGIVGSVVRDGGFDVDELKKKDRQ